MKLVQISFRFEYTDIIERLLDQHGIDDFVRYPLLEGKDCDGKHHGTQVFPGNLTVVQALVPSEGVDALFQELQYFREEKASHQHLQALVLPIERQLY